MELYEPQYYKIANEEGGWQDFPRDKVVEYVLKNSTPGAGILEIGCGTAEILKFLPSGVSYTGLERSIYAISEAKNKWSKINPAAEFIVGDSEFLPFKEAQFDIVLLLFVLEHVINPRAVLSECKRVLRKGGQLIILAPNLEFPLAWPTALRHKYFLFRIYFVCLRFMDYIMRIFGFYAFRVLGDNFTSFTGKYERKDDDLWHMVSSWEVIKFFHKNGLLLEVFWEEKNTTNIKKFIRIFPTLRWYGTTLAAVFVKI